MKVTELKEESEKKIETEQRRAGMDSNKLSSAEGSFSDLWKVQA